MIETIATADSNRELAPGYRLLTLDLKEDVPVRAGQFAMLKPHASLEPLLRRALAVYRVHSPRRISFLYQVLGRGTEALARVENGGAVEALLPLGNSWPDAIGANQRVIVVAGGIGSASVFMLCEKLASTGVDTQLLFGARSEPTAIGCGLEDFRALGLPLTLTTDDGSLGEQGFVTGALERELLRSGRPRSTIYACGPWVMMKRVAEIAVQFEARCFVSLEAPMGCGFGVCVGCVVAVKTRGTNEYGSYKRVCTDGSIFPAESIRWEVDPIAH
ncbi:MAG: dihydroorotate dehydrogenase electron transfer subunit [Acidobacteriota bacterium]